MAKINEIDITSLLFQEGSAPSTPASTKWRAYFKTDGLYVIDDAGTETGPLGTGGSTPTFSGAKVSLTADESIASATGVYVPWDQADYDTDSYWSAGNPTRLTIPTTGYYIVTGTLDFDNNDADGERQALLRKNGATNLRAFGIPASTPATGVDIGPTIAWQGSLTATDYIEVRAYQNSGSSLNLELFSTHVAIALLGT